MISAHLYAGLGNQLFQLAAAHHFSKKWHCSLHINLATTQPSPHSSLNYVETIFRKIPRTIQQQFASVREAEEFHYHTLEAPMPPKIPVLAGYFQSYKYVEDDFAKLLDLDSIYLPPQLKLDNFYFLHIRRRDYIGSGVFDVCSLDYYKRALNLLPKDAEVLIVSDDIQWCKSQEIFSKYYFCENSNELVALKLMSKCLSGGICSNSSFSWWGFYLIPNPEKQGILPSEWLRGRPIDQFELISPKWNVQIVGSPSATTL